MSLQSSSKVRIYSSSESMSSVLGFLQEQSCFEVLQKGGSSFVSSDVSKLEFGVRYLSAYAAPKSGLRSAVLGDRVEASDADVASALSFDWKSCVARVSELEQERNDIERELSEKSDLISLLENWSTVESFSSNDSLFEALFVEVPLQNIDLFIEELAENTSLFEKEEVSRDKKIVRMAVYIERENVSLVSRLLSEYKGQSVSFPETQSPAVLLKELSQDVVLLEKAKADNTAQLELLSENVDSLKIIYDEALSSSALTVAEEGVMGSDMVSYVEGWVPDTRKKLLQYDLERNFSGVLMEELKKEDGDVAPVILSGSPTLQPIQEITKMYGTPAEKELDPTAYYAIFFVIFFGFCLTDAGYGLILMLLTGVPLLMKLPFDTTVKNVVKMFFYGGVSTFILGILFGGYFGLSPDQVPEALTYTNSAGNLMFLGQVVNPMTELVSKVMPLTYLLGILHLFLGLYLSGKIAWKNGDKERMYFVVIPTIGAILSAAMTWGAGVSFFEYVCYGFLVLMVWGLGKNGNPLIRVLKGLGGLVNEVLSWFQNILSYSRLFALGLATGVIGMAFNIVALTLGGMIPGVFGIIVMILVLIFGHVLNIALNLLGAYVHSSRLQFVEFFGLFLEGGGKVFNPLKKEFRYRLSSDS